MCAATASAQPQFFTLSTNRTFAPGEKPQIHLYTRNIDALEFRIYRVRDEERFVNSLAEMHSFGESRSFAGKEQIDEKTWLERFHDWKESLWESFRDFLREQISWRSRTRISQARQQLTRRSRVINAAQFAQIPLLNDRQLVASWKMQVPETFVTDSDSLPIDPLDPGMYLLEATDGHLKAYTLVMVSRMAVVTRTVSGQMLTFVVDRKSGEPVADAELAVGIGTASPLRSKTGADGVSVFDKPGSASKPASANADADDAEAASSSSDQKLWILARHGSDVALVAPWYSAFMEGQTAAYQSYSYTDRPVYRPGHTVYFKTVIRAKNGDRLELPKLANVNVKVSDETGKSIFDRQLPVNAMGSVAGELQVPAGAALGFYRLQVTAPGLIAGGSFEVQEYRKPEYQVKVTAARPHLLQGESNKATIDSRYFFGEPVANAKVKYRIYSRTHYWWDEGDSDEADSGGDESNLNADSDSADETGGGYNGDEEKEQQAKLDADGRLIIDVPTAFEAKTHNDLDYTVEASVTDEAGREITGRAHFLATYGSFRIHAEPVSYAVQQGANAFFNITAVDYDNHPVQTAVHVDLAHFHDHNRDVVSSADVTTGADGKAVATLNAKIAGSLTLEATAPTPERRTLLDRSYLWVLGPKSDSSWFGGEQQRFQIVTDKKKYAPGDTAHVTLLAPVENFHALVMATGYTLEFRKVLDSRGRSASFDLPITKDSQPNIVVDAVFVQDEKLYSSRKSVAVPPVQQQLDLTITPVASTFQPGQPAQYDVLAKDAAGKPVSAELSFGVVDEALYSIYPDTTRDILKAFYPDRSVYPQYESSLTYYFTGEAGEKSPLLAQRRSRYRPQLAQVKQSSDVAQPRVRKAFPDTAFWQPEVRTDATGHARVQLTFPDSLTTWRTTVRAVTAATEVGSQVNRVIVRKNIIVRMGQPRFLRKGDVVTVPVIVHNYLQQTKQVQLSLDATGVDVVGGSAQQVEVAPRGEATVYYRLRASQIGTATLTAKALSTQESDALEISVPVEPSGVRETVAASATLVNSGDRSLGITFPAGTDPLAHTLQVQVSPSIAGSLFSALDYLTSFPYGCTEQTMSSFLPNIIVRQAMTQLKLPSRIDEAALNAKIAAGIERLQAYHHDDGGWGWWKEDESRVFMTAYVVSGLAQASNAGYEQAASVNATGITYLQRQLKEHPRMLPELRAYVVYALAEAGRAPQEQLDTLYGRRNDLSAQALSYTGLAMLDAKDDRAARLGSLVEKKAKVEGELASWPTRRDELLDIDEDDTAETTALALKLLTHTDPQSPLLTEAAQWLVANRSEGLWWSSTQQTAFVIYGLTDYLAVSHELNADIDAELFVNGSSAGHQHFSRDDAVQGKALSVTLDAAHLQPGSNSVRVVTHGAGRVYLSTQGAYFSIARNSYQKGSFSLNIARDYFLLVPKQKDGKIVYTLQPLSGAVQTGDTLAVHLGITGSEQKYLLIEDPIPAGTEFVKHEESYNIEDRPDRWDFWYTRQEFHDDRASIFATTFEKRNDTFYLLKVTNSGSFEISPARVAPMYEPGVQATTDELHLDVKEPGR